MVAFGDEGAHLEGLLHGESRRDVAKLVLERAAMLRRLIARQFPCDPDLVEDLEQEVWFRVLAAAAHRPEADREAAWLAGIARHVCVDAIRERQRGRRYFSTLGQLNRHETTEVMGSLDDSLDDVDRRRIANAVAALPPRVRDVVKAKYYTDLNPREIAATFSMSPGAVRKALSVARRLLRPVLASLASAHETAPDRRKEGRKEGRVGTPALRKARGGHGEAEGSKSVHQSRRRSGRSDP